MTCEDYPCCGHEWGDCDGRLYGDVAAQVRKAWETVHGYCEHESGIFNCEEDYESEDT